MKSNTQPKGRAFIGSYGNPNKPKRRTQYLAPVPEHAPDAQPKLPGRLRPRRLKPEKLCRGFLSWKLQKVREVDINIDTALDLERKTKCAFRREVLQEFLESVTGRLTGEQRSVRVEIVAEGNFPTNPKAGFFAQARFLGRHFILPRLLLSRMRTG